MITFSTIKLIFEFFTNKNTIVFFFKKLSKSIKNSGNCQEEIFEIKSLKIF